MKKYILIVLLLALYFCQLPAQSTRANNSRSDTVDILNYTINLNITDFTTNVIKGNTQIKFTPKVNPNKYGN